MLRKMTALMLAIMLCALSLPAVAQGGNYPTKGVTVIVPDTAGGSTDLIARLTFAAVEKKLGQSFSVVNKPGSGGQLGLMDVARSTPDGYTLGYLTDFATASVHASGEDVGFSVDELAFVCSITSGTNLLALGADFPGEKSIEGFIAYAKENPGALTLGVAASGQSLVLSSLMEEANVQITEVVFNSGNESYTSLIGGHIAAALLGTKFNDQLLEQGCTPIAVTSHTRFSLLPDLPTILEAGYNVLNNEVSRVLVVPKDTPAEVVKLLADTIHEVSNDAEFINTLTKSNEMYLFRTGEEALAVYEGKLEQLRPLVNK